MLPLPQALLSRLKKQQLVGLGPKQEEDMGREPQAFTHSIYICSHGSMKALDAAGACQEVAPRLRKNPLHEQMTEGIQGHSNMVTGSLNPPEKLLSGTRVSEKRPPCPAPGGHDTMWTMCYQRAGA